MHVPCTMFCPYCSFNKFTYTKEASSAYFKRLREEMLHVKALGMILTIWLWAGEHRWLMKKSWITTIALAKKLFSIENVSCETDPNHIKVDTVQSLLAWSIGSPLGCKVLMMLYWKKSDVMKNLAQAMWFMKINAMLGILPITSVDLTFNFPAQKWKLFDSWFGNVAEPKSWTNQYLPAHDLFDG